jgi:polysaccharide deacetylase family protein (PEP-CTERM system associated)
LNILTFDIEDWFHLLEIPLAQDIQFWNYLPSRFESTLLVLLDLLSEHDIKATFFWLGWLAKKNPKLVSTIKKMGHDIGSHSYSHQLIKNQTPDEFKEDLKKSISILQETISEQVIMYRAPGFSLSKNEIWAFECLAELGIVFDSSIFVGNHQHGGIGKDSNRTPYLINTSSGYIKEFPVIPYKFKNFSYFYSGGGYFRVTPYFIIKFFSSKMKYSVSYFHPRDFDVHQPLIGGLSSVRKFKSYYGIDSALHKFKLYIADNKFISISQFNKQHEW